MKLGILRYNPSGDYYAPTLYGAFYMTWNAEFRPFKQMRLSSKRRLAAKEMAECKRSCGK